MVSGRVVGGQWLLLVVAVVVVIVIASFITILFITFKVFVVAYYIVCLIIFLAVLGLEKLNHHQWTQLGLKQQAKKQHSR